MIYSRFGDEVEIVRLATIGDVRAFERRRANKHDMQRIADECYVIQRSLVSGVERLAEIAFLRADRGSVEIREAIERTKGAQSEEQAR